MTSGPNKPRLLLRYRRGFGPGFIPHDSPWKRQRGASFQCAQCLISKHLRGRGWALQGQASMFSSARQVSMLSLKDWFFFLMSNAACCLSSVFFTCLRSEQLRVDIDGWALPLQGKIVRLTLELGYHALLLL
jgi:hypothetical protein